MAGRADGHARHRDRRGRDPPLWPADPAGPAERPALVPGARLGHGDGLALVGHHHVGHGRTQEGPEAARARARRLRLRRPRPPFAAHARRAARRRRSHRTRRRRAGPHQPPHRPRRQQRRRRRLPDLPAHLRGHGRWRLGRGPARPERRHRTGPAVSLALGVGAGLHRRAARRDRRRPGRHDPQPGRSPARCPRSRRCWPSPSDDPGADAGRSPAAGDAGPPRRPRAATSTRDGSARCWRWPTSASSATSPRCCWSNSSGPRTLQSLALVAEVVHGTPTRFDDPARFSFAHGGKDGHPFPVPLHVYDESIAVLRRALDAAKVGRTDKLDGLRRLDAFTRGIEHAADPRADVAGDDRARTRAGARSSAAARSFDDRRARRRRATGACVVNCRCFPPADRRG